MNQNKKLHIRPFFSVDKDHLESLLRILNFKEFINAINKSKPESITGNFINKVYLSTSMGPSIRIENIKKFS